MQIYPKDLQSLTVSHLPSSSPETPLKTKPKTQQPDLL